MSIHGGHRERLRERFLRHGLKNFDDHVALELLLCYVIPRVDLNPLAHELINRFGSLSGVLDAPSEELLKVGGIGRNTASFLNLIPQLFKMYLNSKMSAETILHTTEQIGDYLLPLYIDERDEVVRLLALDAKHKLICCREIARGNVNTTVVSLRRIVEEALRVNCTAAVLSHNHTSGIALPSREDEATTRLVRDTLALVGVELIDHIVVADNDYVSMSESGMM